MSHKIGNLKGNNRDRERVWFHKHREQQEQKQKQTQQEPPVQQPNDKTNRPR